MKFVYVVLIFVIFAGCGSRAPRPEISEALQVSDDTIVLAEDGSVIYKKEVDAR